jgi:putative ABC transport system ATP-binding protein
MTPHIQIRDLVKTYSTATGALTVLNGVNLTAQQGEFLALVGPSGGGKTTLLNMLTGIDRPSSGTVKMGDVEVTGRRPGRLTRWRGRSIGIIFQQFQLLPTLTVIENVVMPMDFSGVHKPSQRREKALALLDRLGIVSQADKTPDMLSGGQQQRVAIARALANDPQLIIGDEPTANLDRSSAQVVFDLLREYARNGHTVLLITHDRELVRGLPRTLALSEGRIDDLIDSAVLRRSEVLKRGTQEFKRATQELRAAHSQ